MDEKAPNPTPHDHTSRYQRVAFYVLAALCLVLGLLVVLPFLPAILWATVLTVLIWPIHERFQKWVNTKKLPDGVKQNLGPLVAVIATLLIICVPFAAVGFGIWVQISAVTNNLASQPTGGTNGFSLDSILQQIDQAARPFLTQIGQSTFSIQQYVNEHREEIAANLRTPATKFAQSAGYTMLTLVIALLTQFFMLRDASKLKAPAIQLIPLPKAEAEGVLFKVRDTIRAVFIGVVMVALIQGAVIGITYAVLKIPNALLLSVASFLLCCIPLLGAPIIYIPVALGLLATGQTNDAIWLLVIGFGVVSQIDNLLRPFVISAKVNLHPMAIFFSLLGGVLAIGPVGLMAGPMLLTVILAVIEVMRKQLPEKPETPTPELASGSPESA